MTRGDSLEQDFRLLINNPKYSDIEICCENEKKLYACRAILAARSEVFDRLLYNGMRESYEKRISFPEIRSSGMEIILEYVYVGSIKEESLTKDNIVEAFYAADYFQLLELQDFIMKTVKTSLERNYKENYSPELLTNFVDTIVPLTEDNALLNLLVETVAAIPLNTIEFGRLSITAVKHLLSCTCEKEMVFATSEYEVFRYSTILAATQVSSKATKALLERLPTLEKIDNSIQNDELIDYQKVAKELEPLIIFIDFKRIKGRMLTDIIEPLKIVPNEIIMDVYRYLARSSNIDLNETRGIPLYVFNKSTCIWDESACGSKLIIEDNGKVVRAQNGCHGHQSVRTKMVLENKGIFDWDIDIEKCCSYAWIGICSSENFDYEDSARYQSTAWVLGSSGSCYHSGKKITYCSSFERNNSKVTVHLDLNKRTCAFTVNGVKHHVVSEWNNLPSKLYFVVSLCYPGRLRIQNFNFKY